METIAIVLSALALLFTMFQFIIERNRAKNESTLVAFYELQTNIFDLEILSSKNIKLLKKRIQAEEVLYHDENWNTLTHCMAKIEHFSVGVNSGIYSIFILNRLAGSFVIERYEYLKEVIDYKRLKKPDVDHYDEFEKMIKRLKRLRKLKSLVSIRKHKPIEARHRRASAESR